MKKTPQKVAYLSRNSVVLEIFHLLPKWQNLCSQMWPIEQLYIELGSDTLLTMSFLCLQVESKRQEDSLRRFRMKECNLLVSSSQLNVGVDNVRANLVIAFDAPTTFKQYTSYKAQYIYRDSQIFASLMLVVHSSIAMKSSSLLGPFCGSEFWGFSLLKIQIGWVFLCFKLETKVSSALIHSTLISS